MGGSHRALPGFCLAACLFFVGILQPKAWEVNVKDDSNKTCIYANMLMNFTIAYETKNATWSNATFVAPSAVKSNRSTCGNDTVHPSLVIDFNSGHSWSLNFTKGNTTYDGSMIVFTYNTNDTTLFPDGKAKGTVIAEAPANQLLTHVQLKTKYRCSNPTTVYTKDVVQIYSSITLQAYVENGTIGQNDTVCSADQPTSAPIHTTASPTTVSPKPTPSKPSTGTYFVKQENVTCILATMGLQLNFTQSHWIANLNPNTTEASGSCGNQTATMVLRDNTTGTIAFGFILANGHFHLKEVNITLLNKSDLFTNSNLSYWDATEGSSYMCLKEQTIEVVPNVSINAFDVKIQPFKVKNERFSTAEHCPAEQESFIVPIAVGVVLGVLVIAVIVAYFIGRKKNTVPRYEQF